jgi:hypothetical protein
MRRLITSDAIITAKKDRGGHCLLLEGRESRRGGKDGIEITKQALNVLWLWTVDSFCSLALSLFSTFLSCQTKIDVFNVFFHCDVRIRIAPSYLQIDGSQAQLVTCHSLTVTPPRPSLWSL